MNFLLPAGFCGDCFPEKRTHVEYNAFFYDSPRAPVRNGLRCEGCEGCERVSGVSGVMSGVSGEVMNPQ